MKEILSMIPDWAPWVEGLVWGACTVGAFFVYADTESDQKAEKKERARMALRILTLGWSWPIALPLFVIFFCVEGIFQTLQDAELIPSKRLPAPAETGQLSITAGPTINSGALSIPTTMSSHTTPEGTRDPDQAA